MKKIFAALLSITVLGSCCCPENRSCEVVDKTYIHRYGVQVDENDWNSRGKSGQVITTTKDGVKVAENYSKGKLHGFRTVTQPHSETLQKTEEYENGALVREVIHYPNGMPEQEVIYHGPEDHTTTLYYDNGTPWVKERLVGNNLHHAEYYNNTHKLEARVDNGYGERVRRDRFGGLQSRDQIENGIMVKRTLYHPNGNPKEVIPYVNGHVEGIKKTFLPDGEPNTVEVWHDNKQDGMTTLYQNGEKITEIPYVAGMKHGVERRYSNGTDVVEEITWVKGTKHGPYNTHLGNKVQTDWYHQGKRVNKATYDFLSRPDKRSA